MTSVQVGLPPKLIPIFDGKADVRGAHGGRGSGKSRSFAKMTAIRAVMLAAAGRSGSILCGRQFQNSLDDSSFAEVKAAIESEPWLKERFDIGERYIRTLDRRVHYVFSGLDRNLSSIKSKSGILLAWIDEAESVKDQAWKVLIPTLREDDVELWITWNPETRGSPVDRRFRYSTDPLIKIVELNWRDNPKFPEKLNRDRLRDQAENPDDYDNIWEGAYVLAVKGAVFVKEMTKAEAEGRVCHVPYDVAKPVLTLWDLGWADSTAIWFVQRVGLEWRALEYQEFSQTTLAEIAKELQSKPYVYDMDWLPHDASSKTLAGDGVSISAKVKALGRQVKVIPRVSHKAGAIDAARSVFPTVWFDREKCADGLNCLRHYAYKVDPETQQFSKEPEHNWASHGADAFMQLGLGVKETVKLKPAAPIPTINHWNRR